MLNLPYCGLQIFDTVLNASIVLSVFRVYAREFVAESLSSGPQAACCASDGPEVLELCECEVAQGGPHGLSCGKEGWFISNFQQAGQWVSANFLHALVRILVINWQSVALCTDEESDLHKQDNNINVPKIAPPSLQRDCPCMPSASE